MSKYTSNKNLKSKLILIGLMGSGKSSVGKLLAKELNREFFDSDKEIEQMTGANIPLIFELEGESGFRKRETQAIHKLCAQKNIVLATGGGAILSAENRTLLSDNSVIIYLQVSDDQILARTRQDRSRPLLQTENPRQKLIQLIAEREPLYLSLAGHTIDTDQLNVKEVTRSIIAALH